MPLSPNSPEFLTVEKYLFRNHPQPGDKVANEDELIAALSLTRYKVRQALDLLVQMGVLDRQKKRGTIVKRQATNDMTHNILEQLKLAGFDELEFNEARLMIELSVLPFVMQRLTPATLAQMRSLAQSIRQFSSDPLKADAFLMEFHLLMLHSCGNRVMEVFAGVVRTYFKSTKHLVKELPKEFFEERAILCESLLKSLQAKDLDKATKTMKEMIEGKPENFKLPEQTSP